MHEGWKSGMVAVEGNRFIVQSVCSSMMMMMTRKKHLESMSKVLSSWRRLGAELRYHKRRIPWIWQPRRFPLNMDGSFYDSFLLWPNRHSFVTHSSNSGAWLNSFVIFFPQISYHSHDESEALSYCHPLLLLWLLFLCCFIIFPMAALLCLLRLRVMTHSWLMFDSLMFDSHYSPCW